MVGLRSESKYDRLRLAGGKVRRCYVIDDLERFANFAKLIRDAQPQPNPTPEPAPDELTALEPRGRDFGAVETQLGAMGWTGNVFPLRGKATTPRRRPWRGADAENARHACRRPLRTRRAHARVRPRARLHGARPRHPERRRRGQAGRLRRAPRVGRRYRRPGTGRAHRLGWLPPVLPHPRRRRHPADRPQGRVSPHCPACPPTRAVCRSTRASEDAASS